MANSKWRDVIHMSTTLVRFGVRVFSRRMMDENYLDLLFESTSVPVLFSEKEEFDSLFTLSLSLQSSECKATLFFVIHQSLLFLHLRMTIVY